MSTPEPSAAMKVGDVVKVRMFAIDEYTPARVLEVRQHDFTVRAERGAFDEHGNDLMALEFLAKGRTWR